MKDFIFYIIIIGFFLLNIYSFYKDRNKYNSTYRVVYFSRFKDWLFAILIVFIFIPVLVLIEPSIPDFLKFGLFSLLEKKGTNANLEIIEQSNKISPYLTFGMLAFFLLIFPKAAYYEEKKFSYDFVADEWKYTNTTIEICQGTEYQELKINSLEELLTLINILSGSPWQKIYQKAEN